MDPACLMCNATAEVMTNLRGCKEYEEALKTFISVIPNEHPLFTCHRCFRRVNERIQEAPFTLSVADVLRSTGDVQDLSQNSNHSSLDILGDESVSESSSEPPPSSESMNAPNLQIHTDSLSTQSQTMQPPSTYRPGPKSSKRSREDSERGAVSTGRVLTAAERVAMKAGTRINTKEHKTVNHRNKSKRHKQGSSSITSSGDSQPSRPNYLVTPTQRPNVVNVGSTVTATTPQINRIPTAKPARRLSTRTRSVTPPQPFIPPSPDSPPLPPAVQRQGNDGNDHSNGAAPRRVKVPVINSRDARIINSKSINGG